MCISCILAVLGLMLLALVLGYLIGRSVEAKKTISEGTTSSGVDSEELRLKIQELTALKTKYSGLESQFNNLKNEHAKLKVSFAEASTTSADTSEVDALKLKLGEFEGMQGKYADLEAQLAKLKAENASLKSAATTVVAGASTESRADERKRKFEALLARIRGHAGEFDWGRIGSSSLENKDNLKRLEGLGASVEKKLNALGIFSFSQMANLSPDDEEKLNNILELPKNKFQKSNWVLNSRLIMGLITQEEIILDRVKGRRDWLNFDRIGTGSADEKDDLQRINGIGPFIEDKLNVLGIYTFRQMSKFTKRDVALVNDAIELNDGHIERDDWVGQAKQFLKG